MLAPPWLAVVASPAVGIPKIAHDALRRRAVEGWLAAHAGERVRLLIAPAGAGKTTALALWARGCPDPVRWIDLPPRCDASVFERLFAAATGSQVAAFAASTSARTVVIDQVDELSPDGRELLRRVLATAPAASRVVLAARSDSVRELAGPAARAADPALFRFDADELLQLCDANGVSFASNESELALQMTNGWATALAETVRAARRGPLPLADAARDWRSGGGVVVQSVVQRILELAPPHDAALLTTVLAEPQRATGAQLRELAGRGLFVDVIDGRAQLNPVVAARGRTATRGRSGRDDARDDEPASVALFGTFRMTLQGTDVHFSRRRDRQIIQYLALAPAGRATRDELFETFWPGGGRESRSQNLRTACSMIRSALARSAGRENVARYFRVEGGYVILDLEHVACDLYAFEAEVARATEAELAGDALRARSAWAAAIALHTAPLLEDEPPAPWIARRAAQVEDAAERARRSAGPRATRTTERRAARLVRS